MEISENYVVGGIKFNFLSKIYSTRRISMALGYPDIARGIFD